MIGGTTTNPRMPVLARAASTPSTTVMLCRRSPWPVMM